ncbi:MAG TPA: undecaprenyldiphospho-muramoylpentapeptide beta-N-acetylglucosaminyltransferase [Candidatus Binatia bacterium]|jgi:UDP-N-acetylglucosamine--N-acetylmuramyl-(pentapeptide) pyrophosphoryl-undecaprenol N-acetylglucosamine transferase|nr:undecaprenyldiphospho-muramoylpentapeptide beta-N-acetylglucosaminyltransferase [Candidatus Binatia bacterium]
MPRGIRLLLAASGTGGHLFPGIAVAEAARREIGAEVLFVGTASGMEKEVIPRLGFSLHLIPAEQLRGRSWWGVARALWAALRGLRAAWRIVRDFAPDLIFSIGGYASGPMVLAGWARRVPCVLLEPNVIPGLTNRLLGRFATRVCVGFPRTAHFFPSHKAVYTGNPVRWSGPAPQLHPSAASTEFTVFIFGGSAGARRLNQTLPQALALVGKEVRVIHQTGKADYAEVSAAYARLGVAATVVSFIDDMQEVYTAADLVVCRAGATTLAELTTLGKPAILIPYPFAADDHQRANAEVLVEAGAAYIILDAELTPERVSQVIGTLVTNPPQLAAMARAAAALGRPDATAAVVRECLACLPQNGRMDLEGACQ